MFLVAGLQVNVTTAGLSLARISFLLQKQDIEKILISSATSLKKISKQHVKSSKNATKMFEKKIHDGFHFCRFRGFMAVPLCWILLSRVKARPKTCGLFLSPPRRFLPCNQPLDFICLEYDGTFNLYSI